MCLRRADFVKACHYCTEDRTSLQDIGIATFLILLWKAMYHKGDTESTNEDLQLEPWRQWPRPPAGFIDLGCVVHLLGLDIRP